MSLFLSYLSVVDELLTKEKNNFMSLTLETVAFSLSSLRKNKSATAFDCRDLMCSVDDQFSIFFIIFCFLYLYIWLTTIIDIFSILYFRQFYQADQCEVIGMGESNVRYQLYSGVYIFLFWLRHRVDTLNHSRETIYVFIIISDNGKLSCVYDRPGQKGI